jgi:hypothetical protein
MAPTRSSGSSNELQTQVELSKRVEIVGAEEAAMLITDAATSDRQALSPTCDRMRTWKSTSSIRLSARGIGSAGVASILESSALYDKLLAFYRARGSRFAIREIVMIQLQSAQPIDSPSESRSLEPWGRPRRGAARIHDGDSKRRVIRPLRERVRRQDKNAERREDAFHFGTSNLRASIFTLTRMRSKVVSSIVCPPAACVILNGHFVPFTSRESP